MSISSSKAYESPSGTFSLNNGRVSQNFANLAKQKARPHLQVFGSFLPAKPVSRKANFFPLIPVPL